VAQLVADRRINKQKRNGSVITSRCGHRDPLSRMRFIKKEKKKKEKDPLRIDKQGGSCLAAAAEYAAAPGRRRTRLLEPSQLLIARSLALSRTDRNVPWLTHMPGELLHDQLIRRSSRTNACRGEHRGRPPGYMHDDGEITRFAQPACLCFFPRLPMLFR